jgi:hypothetical protein
MSALLRGVGVATRARLSRARMVIDLTRDVCGWIARRAAGVAAWRLVSLPMVLLLVSAAWISPRGLSVKPGRPPRRAARQGGGMPAWLRPTTMRCNSLRSLASYNMAGSGRGPWHLARSEALSLGLSNAYFRALGLPSLFGAC